MSGGIESDLRAAIDRVADESEEIAHGREAYFGIAPAIDFLKLVLRIVPGQKLIEESCKPLLLRLGHVFGRPSGDVFRLGPVYVKRILMQIEAKVEKLVGY